MLNNYAISAIRTGVPALVGWLASWLLAKGFDIPSQTRDWLIGLLTFLSLMVYYLVVRLLEEKNPKLGYLLGVPSKPNYTGDPVANSVGTTLTTTTPPVARKPRHEAP